MHKLTLTKKLSISHQTVIELPWNQTIGGCEVAVFCGPCSVENAEQLTALGQSMQGQPISGFRGGAFKPRTSPYDFQGLGAPGLDLLATLRELYRKPIITEVLACTQLEQVVGVADILQVGSRNMQNFELLRALGKIRKPVLLKRGLAATLEEFLGAAEYIMDGGNHQVILCERGIRSFDPYTRNVLDVGAIAALKELTHLPVLADPSHGTGRRSLVLPAARSAIAAGADGLLIECHPDPDNSVTDAKQALSLSQMCSLLGEIAKLAPVLGRKMPH